jgi:hypothetical protein
LDLVDEDARRAAGGSDRSQTFLQLEWIPGEFEKGGLVKEIDGKIGF